MFKRYKKSVSCSARCGNVHAQSSGKILSCNAVFYFHNVFRLARSHYVAAMYTGSGTKVYNPVGGAERLLVMLYDNKRITNVTKVRKRVYKTLVVALVKPYGRLIKNVKNADKTGANLRGKADALRLTAGKCSCLTFQCKVLKPDVLKKAKSVPYFFKNLLCDF